MDAVKVWGFSTCVAVIVGAVAAMIVPSGAKQNIMKLIISSFVLAGMLYPTITLIEKTNFNLDVNAFNSNKNYTYKLNDELLEELKESCISALFPIVKQELNDLGLQDDFGIDIEFSEQKEGLELSSVNITVSDLHMLDKENVTDILKNNTGLKINIDVIESEEIP